MLPSQVSVPLVFQDTFKPFIRWFKRSAEDVGINFPCSSIGGYLWHLTVDLTKTVYSLFRLLDSEISQSVTLQTIQTLAINDLPSLFEM